jgi:hypothetical protein
MEGKTFVHKRVPIYTSLAVVILLATACSPATPALTPDLPGRLPPAAVLTGQQQLAQDLGVPVEQLEIVEIEQVEWPDACLGLAEAGEMCAQVITPGWRAIVSVDSQEYEIRTDETGDQMRWQER